VEGVECEAAFGKCGENFQAVPGIEDHSSGELTLQPFDGRLNIGVIAYVYAVIFQTRIRGQYQVGRMAPIDTDFEYSLTPARNGTKPVAFDAEHLIGRIVGKIPLFVLIKEVSNERLSDC
jgi:hypothetical protein